MIHTVRLLAAVVVLSVMAAACGSDDVAGAPDRFCEISDELEDMGDFFSLPPNEAQPVAERFLELITEAHDIAPVEIRRQVGAIVVGFADLFPDYKAAGFDATRLNDSEIDELFRDDEDIRQAIDAGEVPIEHWVEANCLSGRSATGEPVEPSGTTETTSGSTETTSGTTETTMSVLSTTSLGPRPDDALLLFDAIEGASPTLLDELVLEYTDNNWLEGLNYEYVQYTSPDWEDGAKLSVSWQLLPPNSDPDAAVGEHGSVEQLGDLQLITDSRELAGVGPIRIARVRGNGRILSVKGENVPQFEIDDAVELATALFVALPTNPDLLVIP
ncbi:MAG: hypothetical protein V3U46_10390 [Acidimicrobiia bacterium]